MDERTAREFERRITMLEAEVAEVRARLRRDLDASEKSVSAWKAAAIATGLTGLFEFLKYWWHSHVK